MRGLSSASKSIYKYKRASALVPVLSFILKTHLPPYPYDSLDFPLTSRSSHICSAYFMASKRKREITSKHTTTESSRTRSKRNMSSTKPTTEVSTSSDSKNEGSIYFWREYGSEHCFLSQWYRSDFTTDDDKNIVYKNAEQYLTP